MDSAKNWDPDSPGRFTVSLVDDKKSIRETFRLNVKWTPDDLSKKPAECIYTFEDDRQNREPRGMNLLGKQNEEDASSALPEEIIAKFPDIHGLKDEAQVKAYTKIFDEELAMEWDTLNRLKGSSKIIQPLRGQPEDFKTLPELRFKRDGGLEEHTSRILLFSGPEKGITLWKWSEQHKGSLSLRKWYKFAEELIEAVHRLHLAGATHGYICPYNVIVNDGGDRPTKPRFIGIEKDAPDPKILLPDDAPCTDLMWRRPYDCHEKVCYYRRETDDREILDPFVPGDIFSLGQTLLWLATGELITPFQTEKPWEPKLWMQIIVPVLKSNVRIKEEIFKSLTERPGHDGKDSYDCVLAVAEVVFACLRVTGHRFNNARSVLEVHERFRPPDGERKPTAIEPASGLDDLRRSIHDLKSQFHHYGEIKDTLLASLYERRLHWETLPLTEEGTSSHLRFTVGRSREEIVDALCAIFLSQEVDCKWHCRALSTPTFWFDENAGAAGRVTSAIKIAASRGCKVQWMLLINELRMNDPRVVHVMNRQFPKNWHRPSHPKPESFKYQYEFGWHPMPRDEYREQLRRQETFIDLAPNVDSGIDPGRAILVVPDYSSEGGHIMALRVFPASKRPWRDKLINTFGDFWKKRLSVVQFPHQE